MTLFATTPATITIRNGNRNQFGRTLGRFPTGLDVSTSVPRMTPRPPYSQPGMTVASVIQPTMALRSVSCGR